MKRYFLIVCVLLTVACHMTAQTAETWKMVVKMADGKRIVLPVSSIGEITFEEGAASAYEQFSGAWRWVASPMGDDSGSGPVVSTTATIPFTVTLPPVGSADYGQYLYCRTDSMPLGKDTFFTAEWRWQYKYDEATGKGVLSMLLDESQPVGTLSTSSGTRYVYFLSENIETQRLEGMSLDSEWTADTLTNMSAHEFLLPKTQQIYLVATTSIPYAAKDVTGFLEIYSSVRFVK